jgi:hypothetical protein
VPNLTPLPASNPLFPRSLFPAALDTINDLATPAVADAIGALQQCLLGGGPAGSGLGTLSTTAVSVGGAVLRGGSGVPATSLGAVGDYYFRTDTPGTSLQRIYVKTAAAVWTGVV